MFAGKICKIPNSRQLFAIQNFRRSNRARGINISYETVTQELLRVFQPHDSSSHQSISDHLLEGKFQASARDQGRGVETAVANDAWEAFPMVELVLFKRFKGDDPKMAGWLISRKIPLQWLDENWGYPHGLKTSIWE